MKSFVRCGLCVFIGLIAGIALLNSLSSDKDMASNAEVNLPTPIAYVDLWVWKLANIDLRKAISSNKEFSKVRFVGGDHDYSLRLVVDYVDHEASIRLLERVRNFAIAWGELPENETWHHVDDGVDENGEFKYKRIVESAVGGGKRIMIQEAASSEAVEYNPVVISE